jgi:hypothetical protein
MMQIKKTFYSIVFFLLIANSAISQEKNTKSEAGGPATAKELVGFWKMMPLPNKSANKINPWPQEYQWFCFTENGKVYSMMKSENGEYSSSELSNVFQVLPKDKTPNYKLQGQFVIIDNPAIKNYKELWGTNIFAKDIEGIAKKGDLIMTLDDGTQTGKVVYYRLLRRIK